MLLVMHKIKIVKYFFIKELIASIIKKTTTTPQAIRSQLLVKHNMKLIRKL